MTISFNYADAAVYVCREEAAAYAFVPKTRGAEIVGGDIYVIAYNENYNEDPDDYPEYNLYFTSGLFHTSSGDEEIYLPEDVPDAAKELSYKPTKFDITHFDYEIQIVLKLLEGKTLKEALEEE